MPGIRKYFRSKRRRKRTTSTRVVRSSGKKRRYATASRLRGGPMVGRPKFVLYNKLLQPKVITRLTYCDTVTLGAGNTAHFWRINSLFDPDYSIGGHQPAFHDQWATLYGRYRVTFCSWHLRFMPQRSALGTNIAAGGTATGETHPVSDTTHNDGRYNPCILATELNDTANGVYALAADYNFIRETGARMRHVAFKHCPGKPNTPYIMRGGTSIARILDDPEKSNRSTAFGANPDNTCFLRMAKLFKDGTTQTSAYTVDVRLNMIVELTDPIDVGES